MNGVSWREGCQDAILKDERWEFPHFDTCDKHMRSKVLIGGAIIILIAGAAVFFKKGQKDPEPMPQASETSSDLASQAMTDEASVVPEKTASLLDLLTTGEAVRCSVTSRDGQKYTVTSDSKRVRVEGIMMPGKNPAARETPGMMINDGQSSYIWSGTQGMKFDMTEMMKYADTRPLPNGTPADPKDWKSWAKSLDDSGITYDCGAAVVSDEDFIPPADVQFSDVSQMMKQVSKRVPTQGGSVPGSVPSMQSPEPVSGGPVQQ